MNEIMERLKNFVLAHPEMSKSGFIQGLDKETGKIIIVVNGQERQITIDELENGHLNQPVTPEVQMQAAQPVSNQQVAPALEEIEVMEEPITPMDEPVETLISEPISQPVQMQQISTLKDMKDAIMAKNEAAVDKALATFAIDEKTGSINMNKAINVVTNNSTNNVINTIKDNTLLPEDLSMYDITGKPLNQLQPSPMVQDITSLIDKSFNNILVYVEAARLKNIVFTDVQITSAKKKYATNIQDKINVLGLNKKEEKIEPDMKKEPEKALALDIKPDMNLKKAGFADILILTIIVLIYAAIIINLISRLK